MSIGTVAREDEGYLKEIPKPHFLSDSWQRVCEDIWRMREGLEGARGEVLRLMGSQ